GRRSKRRTSVPAGVRRIRWMPHILSACTASDPSRCPHWRKSPAGGPAALVIRISGAGQADRIASRPPSVVTSATTAVTLPAPRAASSRAVAASASSPRATIHRSTPSSARARAQPLPSPLLAPHRIALRPLIPRSTAPSSLLKSGQCSGQPAQGLQTLTVLGELAAQNLHLVPEDSPRVEQRQVLGVVGPVGQGHQLHGDLLEEM